MTPSSTPRFEVVIGNVAENVAGNVTVRLLRSAGSRRHRSLPLGATVVSDRLTGCASVFAEALRRCLLERRDRRLVVRQGLDVVALGGGERGLGVGQLDDVADAG